MNKYPWTKQKYRRVLASYGMTQAEAADMLGVTVRSGQRWALEAPPFTVCLVFQLMKEFKLLPKDVNKIAQMRGLK